MAIITCTKCAQPKERLVAYAHKGRVKFIDIKLHGTSRQLTPYFLEAE